MTMTDWASVTFPQFNGEIVLESYANGAYQTCSLSNFATITSGLTAPPTHASLSALPIASAGWQPYFDDWKAKGIIA